MCSAVRRRMLVNGHDRVPLSGHRHGTGRRPTLGAGARWPAAAEHGAPAPGRRRRRPPARPSAARPPRWSPAVDSRQDVVAGDPAAGPGAQDLGRVQAVLGDQPAHHGRQELARAALSRRARRALVGRTRTGPGRAAHGRFGRCRALWPAGRRLAPGAALPAVAARRCRRSPGADTGSPTADAGPRRPSAAAAGPGRVGLRGAVAGTGSQPAPVPSAGPGSLGRLGGTITASLVPTETVSPSGTRISVTVPLTGEGTSESTLSVETSNRTSSSATASPTRLCHFVIVPSVTVSPSCGIVMSANVKTSSSQGEHRLAENLRQ